MPTKSPANPPLATPEKSVSCPETTSAGLSCERPSENPWSPRALKEIRHLRRYSREGKGFLDSHDRTDLIHKRARFSHRRGFPVKKFQ